MAGRIQLLLKGLEDTYLTGSPQITYFRVKFTSFDQFELKHRENQFYSTGVAYGGSQLCIIKKYGDIIRSNFLKVKLPSLFVTNSSYTTWCYPNPAAGFRPNIYLFDANFNEIKVLTVNDTCIYYNTNQLTWLPPGVTVDLNTLKFNFNLECEYIGFDLKDEALFWGFKNYDSYVSYTVFQNSRYVFPNRSTSEINLKSAGWLNSYSKYVRTYKPDVGSILVDRVELYIGSQLIETLPGQYLKIYKDISVPQHLQPSLDALEGANAESSTSDVVYYVYLPLSMKNIPICALSRHDVEIRVSFKNFTDLVDSQYLNIDSQFKETQILGDTALYSVFDGSNVFFISNTGVINKLTIDPSIIPTSTIRVNNLLFMTTTDSKIIKYDTSKNTSVSFPYIDAYTVKQSVGLIYSIGLFNFTSNGLVQKITTTDITEYVLDILNIRRVYYFNTYIFIITSSKIYVYKNDFTPVTTHSVNSEPYLFTESRSSLYMASANTLVTYTITNGFESTLLPEVNPTAMVFADSVCTIHGSSNAYINSIRYPPLDVKCTAAFACVIDSTRTSIYVIGDFDGVKYKSDIRSLNDYSVIGTEYGRILTGILVNTSSVFFVSNTKIIYTTTPGNLASINLPFELTSVPRVTYDNDTNILYVIDDSRIIVSLIIASSTVTSIPLSNFILPPILPRSLAYDGRYVYMFPSNGSTKIIKYDTTKNFEDKTSYYISTIIDSATSLPKQMYVSTTTFDGFNIYAVPSASDGNILSISVQTGTYSFLDFVKNGRDYTVQNLTNSIVVEKMLYMFSANGIYRYDTAFAGTSIQPAQLPFSNAFLTIYDQINSNVYVYSNNISVDGVAYINTRLTSPTPTIIKPDSYSRFSNNVFASYVEYGSKYYLIPSVGNVMAVVQKTNPMNIESLNTNQEPNNSKLSMVIGDVIYIFPGDGSSNTIVYNITSKSSNVIQTPVGAYTSVSTYGQYVYLTTSNTITRLNLTLDTFTDFSGYSQIPANAVISLDNFVVPSIDSNVLFITANSIINYDVVSNTYTESATVSGKVAGVSLFTNSNVYILKTNGQLCVSNIKTTNVIDRNDTYSIPVDVSGNAQYIYTLFSNILGRIDQSGDFDGTGYYSKLNVDRPVTGNVTTTFELGGNVYSVFDSNSVTKYTNGVYSSDNIASTNIFSKFFIYNSNVILLSNCDQIVTYNPNDTLTTPNLQLTRLPITNISSVSNTSTYLYFTSSSSNTLVQYNPVNGSNTTYMSNVYGGFAESRVYNSNVYFFSTYSNLVLSYSSRTQNFLNYNDLVIPALLTQGNIISSSDSYVLTDDQRIYKLTDDNTSGSFVGYTWSLVNRAYNGYNVTYARGGTNIIYSTTVDTREVVQIDTDVYFPVTGVWTYNGSEIRENDSVLPTKVVTVTSPGLRRNFSLKPSTEGVISFSVNGVEYKEYIFFVPNAQLSNVIPTITSQKYIASTDGRNVYNLEQSKLYGPYTTTSVYYPFYGTVQVKYNQNQYTTTPIAYQTVDQIVRNVPTTIQSTYSNIFLKVDKVSETSVNIYTTIDGYIPPNSANLIVGSTSISVPGSIVYTFSPNAPTAQVYNFTNVYSTPRFTYLYGDGSNLIVYKDQTSYTSPLRTFPLDGVSNINSMVYQGSGTTTIVYMITNNYSNIVRFNEESDSSSYENFRITNSLRADLSNATTFALSDGIGVITDSRIYGVGIQRVFSNTYTSLSTNRLTSPVFFNSNVNMFSVTGDKIVRAPLVKISDVETSQYTVVNIPSPRPHRYAFYDNIKFMYVVQSGNLLLYNTSTVVSTSFPWDSHAGGIISKQLSYVASSNTNNLLLSYVDNSQLTYKTYRNQLTGIQSNIVQFYDNVAYMLPTNSTNITSFNMVTNQFGVVPVSDYPVLFYRPNAYVTVSNVNGVSHGLQNVHSVVDDGRYLSICSASNIIQYDYISSKFITPKTIASNTALFTSSNIAYFFSPTVVTRYSTNPRSYISTPIESSNGLQFYNNNVYVSSSTNVYRISSNLQKITKVGTALGTPGKSLVYGSNIAFSYPGFILSLDTNTSKTSYITTPVFTNFTIDPSNVFYASSGTSISRNSVVNSNIAYTPTFKKLGPNFYHGSNLYTLTDDSKFVIYNANSVPFASNALFYSQNVASAFTSGRYVYFAPGEYSNIIQRYDMSLPFYERNSYEPILTSNNNYTSHVTLSDASYFIPKETGNLINCVNGSESKGYLVPGGTLTSVYDGSSVYLANSTHVNKFYFTPIITPAAFGNSISFTTQTPINNIIFDGDTIYVLGDYVYRINTKTIGSSDSTGVFQDTSENILDRNKYMTGYFDGRFLNFVTDRVKIYDVLPLDYPQLLSPSIITEYAYISDADRTLLQSRELQYLIKQIQSVQVPTNTYARIEFWNPMSEIIATNGTIDQLSMYLNGHLKFECDANFMETIQILKNHARRPTRTQLYSYSFATNPESEFPDASVNMSRIREKVIYAKSATSSTVVLYGSTHNIVKIRDGLGGLVFNNSTQ